MIRYHKRLQTVQRNCRLKKGTKKLMVSVTLSAISKKLNRRHESLESFTLKRTPIAVKK